MRPQPAEAEAARLLAGPAAPIALSGSRPIADILECLIGDWLAAPAGDAAPAHSVRLVRDDALWRVDCSAHPFGAERFGDGYEVANAVVGALLAGYVTQRPELMLLHAAAAVSDGQLLVLIGDNFAGKSTLAVALAAQGARLACDDRLIVRAEQDGTAGIAPGIAPKLRLPLPAAAPQAFHDFVAAHTAAAWPTLALLHLPEARRLPFGSALPPGRLVLLARREDGPEEPRLQPLSRPDAVRAIVAASFAPHLASPALLVLADRISRAAPAWRLDYRDSFAAARSLLASGPR